MLRTLTRHLHRLFKYFPVATQERMLSSFIPYSCMVAPDVVKTKEGDYLRIWKVDGRHFGTVDPREVAIWKDRLNMMFRSIGGDKGGNEVAFYVHQIRRKVSRRLESEFSNPFCRELDEKYYDLLLKRSGIQMRVNEIYFTLVYRPSGSGLERKLARAIRSPEEIQRAEEGVLHRLGELSAQVESGLKEYRPRRLTNYQEGEATYSEALAFLNFLISGFWQEKVRVPRSPLYEYLGHSQVFVGTETIEIRGPSRTRYVRFLDLKDYPTETYPGILDDLLFAEFDYVVTHSFTPVGKREGETLLKRQQQQLAGSEDGAVSQIAEMSVAIDHLLSGKFLVGGYHFSLAIWGREGDGTQSAARLEELRMDTTEAQALLQGEGFLPAPITTALDAAYYAQLPGNFLFRPRVANITSLNFSSLVSLHGFYEGKREGNPWGQAVTQLQTLSGAPYYFNFHAVSSGDQTGEMVLANTLYVGQSGSGKTVSLAFKLCQLQKFNPITFFFDKDRGAELVIRALGGKYLALQTGEPSGLNPFQLEPNEPNFQFLEQLVEMLITSDGSKVESAERAHISQAVRTVMRFPKEVRRLSLVPQNLTDKSLTRRVERWCVGGPLAWVFDNPVDSLDFTTHRNYGIDGTQFLDHVEVRSPISFYLLHRMEQAVTGQPFVFVMDEFWKWLGDKAFSEYVFNKLKTIRKQNGFGIFATQSLSDVIEAGIAPAIVEQTATVIYLPNPRANRDEYKQFKMTDTEFDVLVKLAPASRLFLVKQGDTSVVASLNLQGLEEELDILSGSTEKVAILHQIMSQVGEEPDAWRPQFHARMAARKTAL